MQYCEVKNQSAGETVYPTGIHDFRAQKKEVAPK
jgi:hypothetical protein